MRGASVNVEDGACLDIAVSVQMFNDVHRQQIVSRSLRIIMGKSVTPPFVFYSADSGVC